MASNIKSGWIWANVIFTVILVAVIVTAYILFHNKWAEYKWQEVQTIEIKRIEQPGKPGEYISMMNTEEGWYRHETDDINTDKYIMWDGYSEYDLNQITWGKAIITGTMALYSIFFIVAVIFLKIDRVEMKDMFYYILVYIIINLIIEIVLVIFDGCQIDRYYKKFSKKEDIGVAPNEPAAAEPAANETSTETETTAEPYTPYKFMNDISEGFSNIKKMLRRY